MTYKELHKLDNELFIAESYYKCVVSLYSSKAHLSLEMLKGHFKQSLMPKKADGKKVSNAKFLI